MWQIVFSLLLEIQLKNNIIILRNSVSYNSISFQFVRTPFLVIHCKVQVFVEFIILLLSLILGAQKQPP